MPKDRFWVLDLAQAIRFEEWPSDEDSGLRFELRSFDDELSAAAFLVDHPEAAASDKTGEEALLVIRDRVLISLRLCWRILSGEPQAARSVAIPRELATR
ncbi:MAG TPA: hypothetical protein VHZ31_06915 [Solirubrobacteraceae bacterium]|nr:hypothetical protein [Solirubrobacteraceae bacterium]